MYLLSYSLHTQYYTSTLVAAYWMILQACIIYVYMATYLMTYKPYYIIIFRDIIYKYI